MGKFYGGALVGRVRERVGKIVEIFGGNWKIIVFLSSVNLLEIGLNLNWLVDGGKLYQPIMDYYMD